MALPAHLLEKLPPALVSSLKVGSAFNSDGARSTTLPTGIPGIDQQLPEGGLLSGAVVELAVAGAASLATSIGLAACRSAQQAAERLGGAVPWCAFLDPSRSLYAPGVAHVGVQLDRLLVVRPPLEALSRVALRVIESQCFAVIVIDTVGMPGAELKVPLGGWPRIVRRLALALQGTPSTALLITDSTARRPLTLPVAQRVELNRSHAHKLILQVAKDRQGRVAAPVSIELDGSTVHEASGGAGMGVESMSQGRRQLAERSFREGQVVRHVG
jgi:recombination protein RecA